MAKGDQIRLIKTSREYRGNTTVNALDTELSTTLLPNENYIFEAYLEHSAETAYEPIRLNFKTSGGATGWYAWEQHGVDVVDTAASGMIPTSAGDALTTSNTANTGSLAFFSLLHGFVSTGGSPILKGSPEVGGVFGLQWAQRISSGSPGGDPSYMDIGSWIILTEVGSPTGRHGSPIT